MDFFLNGQLKFHMETTCHVKQDDTLASPLLTQLTYVSEGWTNNLRQLLRVPSEKAFILHFLTSDTEAALSWSCGSKRTTTGIHLGVGRVITEIPPMTTREMLNDKGIISNPKRS